MRGAAAGLLASITAVAEDAVVEHLAQVLPALCRATVDDEATVRDSAAVCCSLLGRFVDPDAQLAILLPQVTTTTATATASPPVLTHTPTHRPVVR